MEVSRRVDRWKRESEADADEATEKVLRMIESH